MTGDLNLSATSGNCDGCDLDRAVVSHPSGLFHAGRDDGDDGGRLRDDDDGDASGFHAAGTC